MAAPKMDTRTLQMLRCARERLTSLSRRSYQWNGVECRPTGVYKTADKLIVVTDATGTTPGEPSAFDRGNAELTAYIVARALGWPKEHCIQALLRYQDDINVEVGVSIQGLSQRISGCLSKLRGPTIQTRVPGIVMTYLMGFIRRIR
ncbi:MAG: hypothetical protein EA371_07430 [Gammaproteobacteria bacterium]|nr:MAG: hypothetical protein EA371_07430 [Gammaproteobacteria bacterium]